MHAWQWVGVCLGRRMAPCSKDGRSPSLFSALCAHADVRMTRRLSVWGHPAVRGSPCGSLTVALESSPMVMVGPHWYHDRMHDPDFQLNWIKPADSDINF